MFCSFFFPPRKREAKEVMMMIDDEWIEKRMEGDDGVVSFSAVGVKKQ